MESFTFPFACEMTSAQDTLAHAGQWREPFPLASVTKLVATWAVLIGVDIGQISLTDEVGPAGATLRHLLAHAAGIDFDSERVVTGVAQRRIYSNVGIELASQHAAAAAGESVESLLQGRVTGPLGMETWKLQGSPAHGGTCSAADLARFAREVLAPSLISAQLRDEALTVQFPGLDGILPGYGTQRPNDWGLGFEIRGNKSPHWTAPNASPRTAGHFGQSGSFLWVDPTRELAAVFVGAKNFSAEHKRLWPALNEQVLKSQK